MTNKQLEQRLEQLEREVAAIRQEREPKKEGWRAWVGMATDDPMMKEAFAIAQEYREKSRREARRPVKRKSKVKR